MKKEPLRDAKGRFAKKAGKPAKKTTKSLFTVTITEPTIDDYKNLLRYGADELRKRDDEIEKLQKEIANLKREQSRILSENSIFQGDSDDWQQQYWNEESKSSKLQKELDMARASIDILKQTCLKFNDDMDAIRGERNRLEGLNKTYEKCFKKVKGIAKYWKKEAQEKDKKLDLAIDGNLLLTEQCKWYAHRIPFYKEWIYKRQLFKMQHDLVEHMLKCLDAM